MLRRHVALKSFCSFGYISTLCAWKALRSARFFQNVHSVAWITRPWVFFVAWTQIWLKESLHTEHLCTALLEFLSSTQRGKHLIFWSQVFEAGGRSKLMLCGSSNPCWCWSLSGNWCFWSGLQFSDSSITSSCCSWSMFSWFDHNFNFLQNQQMDRHLDYLLLPWVTFLIGVYQLWMLRFHVALMSFCGFGYFSTVWAWKALRITRYFQNVYSVHWIIPPWVIFVA